MLPKLLVYVPTFNRYSNAHLQLNRLTPVAHSPRVTVYLADNAGTDLQKSADLARSCEENGWKYLRRPANIGGHANIMEGLLLAKNAEFIWCLSDDEILLPGAIETVLSAIESLPSNTDTLCLGANPGRNGSTFLSLKDVSEGINWGGFGLISNLIYRSTFIEKGLRAGFDYLQSGFPHLAAFLSACSTQEGVRMQFLDSGRLFSPDHKQKPSEPGDYLQAHYGYVLITETLHDPDSQRRLRKNWWKSYGPFAAFHARRAPLYAPPAFALLKRSIPFFGLRRLGALFLYPGTRLKARTRDVLSRIYKTSPVLQSWFPRRSTRSHSK